MRANYYKLLQDYQLINTLFEVTEVSYSKKTKILKNLLNSFEPIVINKALQDYKTKYINIGKYNLSFLENTLKYLCKLNQRE